MQNTENLPSAFYYSSLNFQLFVWSEAHVVIVFVIRLLGFTIHSTDDNNHVQRTLF